jgi:hypothetical protein
MSRPLTIQEAQQLMQQSNSVAATASAVNIPNKIHDYFELIKSVIDIIHNSSPDNSKVWQLVFAASLEHICNIPIRTSIPNYQQFNDVKEHRNIFMKWNDQYNVKDKSKTITVGMYKRNRELLDDALDYFTNLDAMNVRIDRMISKVYEYNFKSVQQPLVDFEQYMEAQMKDLDDAVSGIVPPPMIVDDAVSRIVASESSSHYEGTDNGSEDEDYTRMDKSMFRQQRMGVQLIQEIDCDPKHPKSQNDQQRSSSYSWDITCDTSQQQQPQQQNSSYTWDMNCDQPKIQAPPRSTYLWEMSCEQRVPITSANFVWELSCEDRRQLPALLLTEIQSLRDQADKFKVNNYTSGDDFIASLKTFQARLLQFATVAYNYLNLPPFDIKLSKYTPLLEFVYEDFVQQTYLYIKSIAMKNNIQMYQFLDKYDYSHFLSRQLILNPTVVYSFINYICWQYSASSPNVNGKTSSIDTTTTIYFNGNVLKQKAKANANKELRQFTSSLMQSSIPNSVVPIYRR